MRMAESTRGAIQAIEGSEGDAIGSRFPSPIKKDWPFLRYRIESLGDEAALGQLWMKSPP